VHARSLTLAAVLALAAVAALGFARPAAAAGGCTLWAASYGDDANPGTKGKPVRTAATLVGRLKAGDVGCLGAGETYDESLTFNAAGTASKPITLTSADTPRATIAGTITVTSAAPYTRIVNVVVRPPTGQGPAVLLQGRHPGLYRSDITGSAGDGSGSCVVVAHAAGTAVDANTIHDCGRATNVYSAGVQVTDSTGTIITNDFIWNANGDAVALLPGSKSSHVNHNIADANLSGVYIKSQADHPSTHNVIATNIISNSSSYSVHGDYPGVANAKAANQVVGNCLWKGTIAASAHGILTLGHNPGVDPRFVNRASASSPFALRPGPCFAKRPQPYDLDPQLVTGAVPVEPLPVLASFTIGLRFTGRVEGLTVSGVPYATVRVRCMSGCHITQTVVAKHSGIVSPSRLDGLGAGAKLRIDVTRTGSVGRFKFLEISSSGVAITPTGYAYCTWPAPSAASCASHP
jgi:Right handed beta helix region